MAIAQAGLARVGFTDYDYWVGLSGGTRLAVHALHGDCTEVRRALTEFFRLLVDL